MKPLPQSVVLRPAIATDAAEVADCVNAAYAKWVPRLGRKPWPMLQEYAAVIANEIVFVAVRKNRIAGVLVLSNTEDEFLIENVAVLPEFSSQGIGRLLLMHAEQEARTRGFDSIYLYTNELMTENILWYAKNGYVEYERRQEEGFRRVFMRKVFP